MHSVNRIATLTTYAVNEATNSSEKIAGYFSRLRMGQSRSKFRKHAGELLTAIDLWTSQGCALKIQLEQV
jgi:hypothetical protein